jgi:hypothetical protein
MKPALLRERDPASPPRSLQWLDASLPLFVLLFGGFLGLALIKFGNPVILDHRIPIPKGFDEWLSQPWPVGWANVTLLLLGLWAGMLFAAQSKFRAILAVHRVTLVASFAWLLWQYVSSTRTVDRALTAQTMPQLAGCVACFAMGLLILGRVPVLHLLWFGLLAGLCFSLVRGANQHLFEFKRDRQTLVEGEKSGWKDFPPEILRQMEQDGLIVQTPQGYKAHEAILLKLSRGRVNGTLVYPNAFAGAILLLLPIALELAWRLRALLRPSLSLLPFLLTALLGFSCLYWTGSKSGWLIALATLVVVVIARAPLKARSKGLWVSGLLLLGFAFFWLRFGSYFAEGARSVGARFDYWRAALHVVGDNPLFGTGPGTFQRPYARLKSADSEMARLVHNDYLEQASDSGIPGALAYCTWIGGILWAGWNQMRRSALLGVAVGVLAWFAQGLVEFGLYIPGLAWTAFTLGGILCAIPPRALENNSTIDPHRAQPQSPA